MLSIENKTEWQFLDEKLGILYPWYTKSFLDVLDTWDLKNKSILELGGGYSTLWWNKKSDFVVTLESNLDWIKEIKESCKDCLIVPQTTKLNGEVDIIILDSDWCNRDELFDYCIDHIKNNGILIVDNWMQLEVWVSECPEKLLQYEHKIFKQDGHPHWQTAYFIIKK